MVLDLDIERSLPYLYLVSEFDTLILHFTFICNKSVLKPGQ